MIRQTSRNWWGRSGQARPTMVNGSRCMNGNKKDTLLYRRLGQVMTERKKDKY